MKNIRFSRNAAAGIRRCRPEPDGLLHGGTTFQPVDLTRLHRCAICQHSRSGRHRHQRQRQSGRGQTALSPQRNWSSLLDEAVSTRQALSGPRRQPAGHRHPREPIGFGAFAQPQEFLVVRPQRPRDRRRYAAPLLFAFLKEGTGSDIHNIGLTADSLRSGLHSFPLLNDRLIGVRGKFLVGAARARMYFTRFT